jgi:2,4-dienoyl-CoA reductase-like NADH-dependent reductase (Old Yellow Enzyme family)
VVRQGDADLVGLGRGAFAYPDFARDLLREGALDPKKCCITCSRCTQIMRDGGQTGCVVIDREVYGPIYRAGRARR